MRRDLLRWRLIRLRSMLGRKSGDISEGGIWDIVCNANMMFGKCTF